MYQQRIQARVGIISEMDVKNMEEKQEIIISTQYSLEFRENSQTVP